MDVVSDGNTQKSDEKSSLCEILGHYLPVS
jgi:hypothetical protein